MASLVRTALPEDSIFLASRCWKSKLMMHCKFYVRLCGRSLEKFPSQAQALRIDLRGNFACHIR